jgi:hypothetical protein
MGCLALFALDLDRFPSPVFAELVKEPFLGVLRMTVYLGKGGNPDIGDCLHWLVSLL